MSFAVVEGVVAGAAEQDGVVLRAGAAEGPGDDVVGDAGVGGSSAAGALAAVVGAVLQRPSSGAGELAAVGAAVER